MAFGDSTGAALVSGASSYFQGRQNRRNMKTGLRLQQQFSERMRSTQYQTAVEDMKAAGINPMVAYSQGGAGTPSGGSQSASGGTSPGEAFISTAMQGKRLENENKITAATDSKLHAEAAYIEENKKVATATELRIKAETERLQADTGRKEDYGDSLVGRTWQTIEKFGKAVAKFQWELGGKIYQWLPDIGKWKITKKQQRKNQERRNKSRGQIQTNRKRVSDRRARQEAGHLRHGHTPGYHLEHGTKKGHSWRSK